MKQTKHEKFKKLIEENLDIPETVKYVAYGVKQPHILLIILFICIAILPGMIVVFLMTKNYVIGITNTKLIILDTGLSMNKVKKKMIFDLDQLNGVFKTRTGGLFTHINLKSNLVNFVAKFHRAAFPENRSNAIAIAEEIKHKIEAV